MSAAIWIENMNTVLDDNKKLCLMSGEMISMSSVMSMIFEVQDLAVASPATVSRCGMVYVEPSQIGWEPLLTSWPAMLPEACQTEVNKQKISNLFGWLVPAALRYVNKECKSSLAVGIAATDDITRVNALMKLMSCHLDELRDADRAAALAKELPSWIENLFLFSLIWSVAGVIDGPSRPKFDAFLRQFAAGKPPRGYEKVDGQFGDLCTSSLQWAKFLPEEASCFEYLFLRAKNQWVLWTDTIDKADTKIPPTAEFSFVPSLDTARYTYLLDIPFKFNMSTLFVGPTARARPCTQKLLLGLPAKEWASIFINYSAQTTANQAQDIIDMKLDKRRRGRLRTAHGQARCHLRGRSEHASPRADVRRAAADRDPAPVHGPRRPGTTARRTSSESWSTSRSSALMASPGGGRNTITPRYMRHFNIIAYTPFDDASMQRIFQTIFDWRLAKEGFDMGFMKLSAPIIAATMDIYKSSMLNLLPTPSKSHHTFNLRDFARVVQGMLLSNATPTSKSLPTCCCSGPHEVFRVFLYDRLTDDDDRLWFIEEMKKLTQTHFQPINGQPL